MHLQTVELRTSILIILIKYLMDFLFSALPEKKIDHLCIFINSVIPCDEKITKRRQKSLIVKKLLGEKCSEYTITHMHGIKLDTDRTCGNDCLD